MQERYYSQWQLHRQKDPNNNNQHHGGAVGITLPPSVGSRWDPERIYHFKGGQDAILVKKNIRKVEEYQNWL